MILYTKNGEPINITLQDIKKKVVVLKIPNDGPINDEISNVIDHLNDLEPEMVLILGPTATVESFDETNIGIHPKILKKILNRLIGVTE